MKMLKNEKGFTLIELVLVIVVLGVLAAAATVQFGNIIQQSRHASIDGTFGQFNAQLALAIHTLKTVPTEADNGTFETEVQDKVSRSGNINWTDYAGAAGFEIIAGGDADTTCEAGESQATVTYDDGTGALTLGVKSDC